MARSASYDRRFPGDGPALAADSYFRSCGGAGDSSCWRLPRFGSDVSTHRSGSTMGSSRFARIYHIRCATGREEGAQISLLQAPNHGGGRGRAERNPPRHKRTRRSLFQDGPPPTHHTPPALPPQLTPPPPPTPSKPLAPPPPPPPPTAPPSSPLCTPPTPQPSSAP